MITDRAAGSVVSDRIGVQVWSVKEEACVALTAGGDNSV